MPWMPAACGSLRRVLGRLAARRQPLSVGMPAAGSPRLTTTSTGQPRCVACALCAGACPARCIDVTARAIDGTGAGDNPDPERGRAPAVFSVDLGRCISCGLCAAACPEEAITLTPSVPLAACTNPADLRLQLDELLEPA